MLLLNNYPVSLVPYALLKKVVERISMTHIPAHRFLLFLFCACIIPTGLLSASEAPPLFIRFADILRHETKTSQKASEFYIGGEMRRVLYSPTTVGPTLHEVNTNNAIELIPREHLPPLEEGAAGLRIRAQYAPDANAPSPLKRKMYVFIPRSAIQANKPLYVTPPGQPETHAHVWARQAHSPDMSLAAHPVIIPENARLDFCVALQNDWKIPGDARIRFHITAVDTNEITTIYDEVIACNEPGETSQWQHRSLDLHSLAGREMQLTFVTEDLAATEESQHAFPLWADPILYGASAKGKRGGINNVILIALDTLRADHLGCYGYKRRVSPNIDRLASENYLFENAFALAPWTTPSFASVFTGRLPAVHEAGMVSKGFVLDTRFATLAEHARRAGLLPVAFTEGVAVRAQLGFSRGFDFYSDGETPLSHCVGTAESTFRRAAAWLERYGHLPFMLFVHTYEPHDPYDAPEPWKLMFADAQYAGDVGGQPKRAQSDADKQHLRDRYDGCIAYTDHWVGWFIEQLERMNLRENTAIVFFSDHGEEFWEHGNHGHLSSIYDETLHVPLILSIPGMKEPPARIAKQVALTDIHATILQLLDTPCPSAVDSHNLLPLIHNPNTTAYSRTYVAGELRFLDVAQAKPKGVPVEWVMRSMRTPVTKYIISDRDWVLRQTSVPTEEKEYKEELYDLLNDPAETQNLIQTLPELAKQFRKAFRDFFASFGIDVDTPAFDMETSPHKIEQDTMEALQSLGYL